jgi:hypothetical protein
MLNPSSSDDKKYKECPYVEEQSKEGYEISREVKVSWRRTQH